MKKGVLLPINYGVLIFLLLTLSCRSQHSSSAEGVSLKINEERDTSGEEIHFTKAGFYHIYQDTKGNYWFASEGVIKYDGKNITRFKEKDGLYSNRVNAIKEDHLGNIYFATNKGINKYDGSELTKLVVTNMTDNIWALNPNDLWFKANQNQDGIYRYDGKDLFYLTLPKHEAEDGFILENLNVVFSPYQAYTIFKDSKGYIWIGTSTFGACRYDGHSFTWVSELEMTEIEPGPAPGVRSILEDQDGNFWFSSNVTSKYKMLESESNRSGKDKVYLKLEGIDVSKNAKMNPFCMALVQSPNGDIWLTTYSDGVWRYSNGNITHYDIKDGNSEVLLFTIYKDNYGDIWLGTHNAGAFKFNGVDFVNFDF